MKPSNTFAATRGPLTRLFTFTAAALCTFAATSANAQLTGTFKTTADVPVTAVGYAATGTMTLTLNCALPTGTNLTVVKNTSQGFITGSFSNLVQGKTITLSYSGLTYQFIVNYYGGTGNDLVLQWAKTRTLVWGDNGYGQFGNGSVGNSSNPIAFFPKEQVTASAAGNQNSIALHADGTVTAAGYNTYGQLGNNQSTGAIYDPVSVNTDTGVSALFGKRVIALSAGYLHSLTLCSDGTLAAWGNNESGQLGDNGVGVVLSSPARAVPTAVATGGALNKQTVVAISSGYGHNLALCSDGKLVSWGLNNHGQLGNSSTANSTVPVFVNQKGVLLGKQIIAISAGYYHSLALCLDGTVAAWGSDTYGELGNNANTDGLVPVKVVNTGVLAGRKVIAISAGYGLSMALCSDGGVATWGYSYAGQLGNNGATGNSAVPVTVDNLSTHGSALYGKTVLAITAGIGSGMALCSDGTVATWGYNGEGELGDSTTTSSPLPVKANIAAMLNAGERVVRISTSSTAKHTVATVALPPLAGALTLAATAITATSATLKGQVTPSPSGSTTDGFNYGLTKTYSMTVWGTPHLVTGTATKTVSKTITGLLPSTTYHFRITSYCPAGTTHGEDMTFTTPAH